jgi:hypothetical protein
MRCALPDTACLGLLQKPLDAAIGQLLSPYCLGGCWGNSKQNNDEICTNMLAVLMAMALRQYNTVRIT